MKIIKKINNNVALAQDARGNDLVPLQGRCSRQEGLIPLFDCGRTGRLLG